MKTRTWEYASRLTGRLLIVIGLLLTGATMAKASPGKTLVKDVLYRADGSAAQGSLTIRWNGFSTSAGEAVAAGEMTVATGVGGAISIPLIPNAGATPAGGYYRVVIKLSDGTTSEENWVVPATATTTLSAIRAKIVPQSVAAQFVSRDYVDGEFAELATVATSGSYSDLKNTPLIPNLASPGPIGGTTPGPVSATDVMPKNTPYADVRAYGGTCNGTADDTAAMQAALNAMPQGGTVYAHNCRIGGVTFPQSGAAQQHVKLLIDGTLALTATLVVPSFVDVEGVAGSGSTQFGIGPVAAISPPATGPAVQFTGLYSSMKNVSIYSPAGYGLDLEFSDFDNFENVQIMVPPGNTTGAPLYIASGMHLYFNNCVFSQWNPNTPWSVHYTIAGVGGVDTPNSDAQEGSTIVFTNSRLVGYGVLIDNQVSVTGGGEGPFKFTNVRYQSGHGPFITTNTVHGGINGITIDWLDNEDGFGSWPLLHVTPGTNYPVANVNLWHIMGQWANNGTLINSNAPQIRGLYLDGEDYPIGQRWSVAPQTSWQWSGGGKLDTDLQGLPLSPITIPYATQSVNFPNGGTCATITGPDGLPASGERCTVSPNSIWSTNTTAVGDWVIWGGWVKGDIGNVGGDFLLWTAFGTGGVTFDNGSSASNSSVYASGGSVASANTDGAWHFISRASKVTAQTGAGNNLIVSPSFWGQATGSFAYPFVVYVPASAGVADAEVIRWQRHLLKGIIPANASAGTMAGVITAASAATLTNKTFDTAGAGNVLKINGTQVNSSTGSGAVVLASAPTFTGAPITPSGNTTTPGIQIGATGNGLSSYAGNQVDFLLGGSLVAAILGNQLQLFNGSFAGTIQNSTLTANRTYMLPDASGNVVLDSAAQTLSNKTLNSAVFTGSAPSLPGAVFTSAPVTPGGNTSSPGLQVGAAGSGFSNYAGNQIDVLVGGATVLQIMPGSENLQIGSYSSSRQSNTLTANRTFTTPDGASYSVMPGSLTTTNATSDTVTLQGLTSSGHCSLTATNLSAATNLATTYVSAKTTNQITVAHAATSGMTYDVLCTSN